MFYAAALKSLCTVRIDSKAIYVDKSKFLKLGNFLISLMFLLVCVVYLLLRETQRISSYFLAAIKGDKIYGSSNLVA